MDTQKALDMYLPSPHPATPLTSSGSLHQLPTRTGRIGRHHGHRVGSASPDIGPVEYPNLFAIQSELGYPESSLPDSPCSAKPALTGAPSDASELQAQV